jgi:hypothetical protein
VLVRSAGAGSRCEPGLFDDRQADRDVDLEVGSCGDVDVAEFVAFHSPAADVIGQPLDDAGFGVHDRDRGRVDHHR